MNRFAEIIDGAVREVDSTADFTKDQVRVQKNAPLLFTTGANG